MIKKILLPLLVLTSVSCQQTQVKNDSGTEVINHVVYNVKFDTLIVTSCERHRVISVMDEINPSFDISLSNGRTMRSQRSMPIGDTIYTKTLTPQWQQ